MRAFLPTASILTLSACALGQIQIIHPSMLPGEEMIPWPAAVGSAPTKLLPMVWHNLDFVAAVGLHLGEAGLVHAPAITHAIEPLALGFTAVDGIVLDAGDDRRDTLLVSAMSGTELRLVGSDANGDTVVAPLPHTGWLRANLMSSSADTTGTEILARSRSSYSLLRMRFDNASSTFADWPTLTLPEPILDLCLTDYDGVGALDTAVLTATSLTVYDAIGNTLGSMPIAAGIEALAVEPTPAPGQSGAVTVLQRTASGTLELVYFANGVAEVPAAVSFDTFGSTNVRLVSGDFNGDGSTDLGLQNGGNKLRIVANGTENPHYFYADEIPLMTIGNQGGTQGNASVGDYDLDGVVDLLVPITASGATYLVLETGLVPQLQQLAPPLYGCNIDKCWQYLGNPDRLDWQFDVSPGLAAEFPSAKLTLYWAHDSAGLGTTSFATPVTATALNTVDFTCSTSIADSLIERPNAFFATLQFSYGAKKGPTFRIAGTADPNYDATANPPMTMNTGWYIPQYGTGPDRELRREEGQPHGRKVIGLVTYTSSLPIWIQ